MHKICRQCNRSLPNTREFFKRCKDPEGKEQLTAICKECIAHNLAIADWKDGKLLCHICHQYLEPSNFDTNKSSKNRGCKDKRCKHCKKKLQNESIKNKSSKQKLHYILDQRLRGAMDRSKSKNLEYDITLDFLYQLYEKQEGLCALSGIKMTYDVLSGRTSTNISIDKIDPNKGYTQDNIQLVCMAVNEMKNDRSIEELQYFCECILNKKIKSNYI